VEGIKRPIVDSHGTFWPLPSTALLRVPHRRRNLRESPDWLRSEGSSKTKPALGRDRGLAPSLLREGRGPSLESQHGVTRRTHLAPRQAPPEFGSCGSVPELRASSVAIRTATCHRFASAANTSAFASAVSTTFDSSNASDDSVTAPRRIAHLGECRSERLPFAAHRLGGTFRNPHACCFPAAQSSCHKRIAFRDNASLCAGSIGTPRPFS
jgi:hypothetical protein